MRSADRPDPAVSEKIMAWMGHSWEQWVRAVRPEREHIASPQAGRRELLDLLCREGPDSTMIRSIGHWEAKRQRITAVLERLLGQPSDLRQPEPQVVQIDQTDCGDHIRRHVKIRSEPEDWVPAYVLVPNDGSATRRTAVICLHQTVPQGKDEPAGISGDPTLAIGLDLVRRGYVCVLPDMIGFGERIGPGAEPYADSIRFYRRHPRWSFFGKMIWDVSRTIDYALTLEQVDASAVGCIGHSHGAYTTLFAAACDERIRCAVLSCGLAMLRSDTKPERWSHLTPLLPVIGLYLPHVEQIPFDFHEVVAMVAPRALFNWSSLNDPIFPRTRDLRDVFRQLRSVYALYGSAEMLSWEFTDEGHGFPAEAHDLAYPWIEQHLTT